MGCNPYQPLAVIWLLNVGIYEYLGCQVQIDNPSAALIEPASAVSPGYSDNHILFSAPKELTA
jgi:hypothetical protein